MDFDENFKLFLEILEEFKNVTKRFYVMWCRTEF